MATVEIQNNERPLFLLDKQIEKLVFGYIRENNTYNIPISLIKITDSYTSMYHLFVLDIYILLTLFVWYI